MIIFFQWRMSYVKNTNWMKFYIQKQILYRSFFLFLFSDVRGKDTFVLQTSTALLQKLSSFSIHTFLLLLALCSFIQLHWCWDRRSSAFPNCCFFFYSLNVKSSFLRRFFWFYRQMITAVTITSSFGDTLLKFGPMLAEAVYEQNKDLRWVNKSTDLYVENRRKTYMEWEKVQVFSHCLVLTQGRFLLEVGYEQILHGEVG